MRIFFNVAAGFFRRNARSKGAAGGRSASICDIQIQKRISRSFGKSFSSRKNSFALPYPHVSRRPRVIAQSRAEKLSFPFRRKNWWRAQNQNCKESFSARQAAVLGGWRRASEVQEFLIK